MDAAHRATDKELERIEKKLTEIYKQAAKELGEKADKYFERFKELDQQKQALVKAGKMTEAEYKKWRHGKLMTGEHWKQMQKQAAQRLTEADRIRISFSVSKPASVIGNQTTGCILLATSPLAGGYLCSTKTGRVGLSLAERDDTCFPEEINCEDKHTYKIWWDHQGMNCECENYFVSREYSNDDEQQELKFGRGSHADYMPRWFTIYGSISVYYQEELIAKYCPCYHILNNEIGFYDIIGETFYHNIGTVQFTRGADI